MINDSNEGICVEFGKTHNIG